VPCKALVKNNIKNNNKSNNFNQDMSAGSYDEVDLEDMDYDEDLGAYTYQCPCGDIFRITLEEMLDGEDIARCPSCSLVLTVVYDADLLPRI
jgi:diphthamide biosynthesis protein 3